VSTDEFDLTISDSFRTPGRRKNNFTAVVAPTVSDDAGDGYEVGSRWVDTVLGVAYELVDSTTSAECSWTRPSVARSMWTGMMPRPMT
jgi:hypothetical protein